MTDDVTALLDTVARDLTAGRSAPTLADLGKRQQRQQRRSRLIAASTAAACLAVVGTAAAVASLRAPTRPSEPSAALTAPSAGPADQDGSLARQRLSVTFTPDPKANVTEASRITRCLLLTTNNMVSIDQTSSPTYYLIVEGQADGNLPQFDACLHQIQGLTIRELPASESNNAAAIDNWPYSVSEDGRRLTVQVPVAAGCDSGGLPAVAVDETGSEVLLHARVTRITSAASGSCDNPLRTEAVTVELTTPLGDRAVVDGLTQSRLRPAAQ